MNKRLILLTLLGLVATNASLLDPTPQRDVTKSKFGAMEVVDWHESGMQKTVHWPSKTFYRDYVQQAEHLKEAVLQIEVNKERIKDGNIYKCGNRDSGDERSPAYFLPLYVGTVSEKLSAVEFGEGTCFQKITFSQQITRDDAGEIQEVIVTADTEKPKSIFCKDWFFFGTTELYHVETFFFHGKHTITFKNLNKEAKIDVEHNGIQIYMFCDGYVDTFVSVFKTALCFVGGLGDNPDLPIIGSHVPDYMVNANLEFLKVAMGYVMEKREVQEVDIDENLIQSGDFISIMRLDGLDPIIGYGSGSHAGHSTMALRADNGDLYIVESQDGWYWPVHGIQKNKFSQWMQWARNADFHVVHLPLSDAARAQFNNTAAWEFFNSTEGLPYGYHNFLFGWIDTPENNWPPLLPAKFVPIVFSILEKFLPDTVDIFFNQALNFRLGTKGLNVEGLAAAAAEKNITLEDVMAMPEIDGWQYEGIKPRDGSAYVCSAYVAALYQAAGLLGEGVHVNGTEFTPRDVYTLNLFNTTQTRPDACVKADPTLPYCQLTGKYRMTLPGYSTITPYNQMAQTCPSLAPDYFRPDGC